MKLKVQAALAYAVFALVLLVGLPLMAVLRLLLWPFDRNTKVVGKLLRILATIISRSFPPWHMTLHDVPKLEKGKRYVFVSNHESILDIFMLARVPWEMKWMAKRSLFKIPVLGQMFQLSGDIPVDRASKISGHDAITRAREYVERGMPVMIFPEGTRSRAADGLLLPFKPGAFRLAVDTGAELVPIACFGTAPGMPVGSPWVRPTNAHARILPAIPTKGLTSDDIPALVARVREQIQAARDELARDAQRHPEASVESSSERLSSQHAN